MYTRKKQQHTWQHPPESSKIQLTQSQVYRLRCLCHSDENVIEKALEVKQHFLERGYSTQCGDETYHISKSRSDLLKKRKTLLIVLSYTPQAHIVIEHYYFYLLNTLLNVGFVLFSICCTLCVV